MSTRRGLMATAAFAGAALSIKPALAQAKPAEFLFVQNAASMSYANGKLTLKDVSPVTIFFSDRPDRIAGNMATQVWVPFWNDGKDSFAKDNPNANLSVLDKDKTFEDIVVTLSNPVLSGKDLSYDVKVLQGTMPASGGPASLFIDIIGMPLTPLSYAGVARRTAYRRAVIRR